MASTSTADQCEYHDIIFGGFKITNTIPYVRNALIKLLKKFPSDFLQVEDPDAETMHIRSTHIINCLTQYVHYAKPVNVISVENSEEEAMKLLERYRLDKNGPALYWTEGKSVMCTHAGFAEHVRQSNMLLAGFSVYRYYEGIDEDDDRCLDGTVVQL